MVHSRAEVMGHIHMGVAAWGEAQLGASGAPCVGSSCGRAEHVAGPYMVAGQGAGDVMWCMLHPDSTE